MHQSRPIGCSELEARSARGAWSTLLWRPRRTGQGRRAAFGAAFAVAAVAALLLAAAPAGAQEKTVARSTPAQDPQVLCDTTPVKLVRHVPIKPRGVAAGHRRKVVRPKAVVPVVKKVVPAKPKAAVSKAAGHRRRPKPVAPRKPNCVKAAAAVIPTPEAKQALVAALPWTTPTAVTVPTLSPFSLPGTIGGGSNAWALGLAGLSAFYFVGHDHTEAPVVIPPPPTVTPEPASFALLATGLVALGAGAGIKRRRSRQRAA
jgi:hypothetical protein